MATHGIHGSKLAFLPQCSFALIFLLRSRAHGDRGLCGGVNDGATHAKPELLSHLHRDDRHAGHAAGVLLRGNGSAL